MLYFITKLVILERILATYYVNDYEKKSRLWISAVIFAYIEISLSFIFVPLVTFGKLKFAKMYL